MKWRLWRYDLALVGVVVLLYREVVFGTARILGRDALPYMLPIGHTLRNAVLGDGSLLWDGRVDHGLPLIGRWATMVFYPAQWLNLVFAPVTATSVAILLHLIVAGMAVLRLAQRYGASPPAAWVGAASFACCGYVVSMTGGGGYLFGACLLPVALLALHRLAESPTVGRAAALAAVGALQVFCADPQTLFYEALVLALPIVLFHPGATGTKRRRLAMAALAGVLALGLSAAQWVPTAEFSRLSTRAGGLVLDRSVEWSFHPLRLVQFFSPHALGVAGPVNTFWARGLVNGGFSVPWAPLIYGGLLIWAGLVAAHWKRRQTQVVAALTLLFLLLACGPATPAFAVLTRVVPGAGFFRYPEKFLLFVSLGLCLLGAGGLNTVHRALLRGQRVLPAGVFLGVLALAAAALRWRLMPEHAQWFADLLTQQKSTELIADGALDVTASSMTHTAVIAAIASALCLFGSRLRPALLAAVVSAVTIFDLVPAALPQRALAEAGPYLVEPPACAALTPAERGLPPLIWRYQPKTFDQDLPAPEAGESRFEIQRAWEWDTLRPNTGITCARHADGYEAARLGTYRRLWSGLDGNVLRRLQLFGVQNVLAVRGTLDPARFVHHRSADALNLDVFDVPGALPYAFVAAKLEPLGSQDPAARLGDLAFDFTTTVLLERPSAPVDFGAGARKAVLRSWRAGDVWVDAELTAGGVLMLQESFYPGWRAERAGQPLTVERANGHFLAVELPAGTHAVHFVFDPRSQKVANAISVLAVLAWLAALAAARVTARR